MDQRGVVGSHDGMPPTNLAALWGIEPVRTQPVRMAQAIQLPAVRDGELPLGGGRRLVTSGGLTVGLPRDPGQSLECALQLEYWAAGLLSESYRPNGGQSVRWPMRTYYRIRPALPRSLQLWMRRRHARHRQRFASRLAWPIDPLFVAIAEAYLALRVERSPDVCLSVRPRWPEAFVAAASVTHDVEGVTGQARCREVMALERRMGVRSSFNFVAERYPVDYALLDEMRADGFEVGLHGIKHDGRKFSSRRVFEERLRLLRHYRDQWRVVGFRSPATHRRWSWMHELPFDYDSSYPDTDPFEPIPGGCASPWPFMIGSVVELPVTMPQDHTLWEILQLPALPVWLKKLEWLRHCGGLATIIVHPDYLTTAARWGEYERLLSALTLHPDVWVALPRVVAQWWRERPPGHDNLARLESDSVVSRLTFSRGTA
jgi:hypothetical protein